jgi:hypothetical protein
MNLDKRIQPTIHYAPEACAFCSGNGGGRCRDGDIYDLCPVCKGLGTVLVAQNAKNAPFVTEVGAGPAVTGMIMMSVRSAKEQAGRMSTNLSLLKNELTVSCKDNNERHRTSIHGAHFVSMNDILMLLFGTSFTGMPQIRGVNVRSRITQSGSA